MEPIQTHYYFEVLTIAISDLWEVHEQLANFISEQSEARDVVFGSVRCTDVVRVENRNGGLVVDGILKETVLLEID